MNSQLALFGGDKLIKTSFKRYNPIGSDEVEAAKTVIESGVLSQFLGCWDPNFYGGPQVQELERACESFFNVRHAVTVNSATSGLIAAIGALEIEPGDEIIVSPWTMCASATAILHWNAIPIFADIDPETFCIDPLSIEKNITPYTRAILAVDIFGHSVDMDLIQVVAKKYGLKIISDASQSPGALYKGNYAGTLADVGVYSLNYHKHIHTGEGGIIVTNNSHIAEKLQLIRNHAEAVVGDKGVTNLTNMVGYNFRLGEVESAIGKEQLKKLARLVASRQYIADRLREGLHGLDGIKTPTVQPNCTHVYYMFPMILDINKLGISRACIFDALTAEGIEGLSAGYANIHLLPMYQQKIAYGSRGFPWSSEFCRREVDYSLGICPVAENFHHVSYLGYEMCLHDLNDAEIDLVIQAFWKVWDNLSSLRQFSGKAEC